MPKSILETQIDKATNENNVETDWGLMMEIVDEINQTNSRPFKLELCSRVFTEELKAFILKRRFPQLSDNLANMIEKWSNENDFKSDPAFNLIPTLYIDLKRQGVEFTREKQATSASSTKSNMKSNLDAQAALEKKEEEDLAKAIQLSLKESNASSSKSKSGGSQQNASNSGSSSLFGSLIQSTQAIGKNYSNVKTEKRKIMALYDFEAVEDNEITFKAGDLLYLTDDSDPNWWKGTRLNGDDEGLFPSNFVTFDLNTKTNDDYITSGSKKVSFNEKIDINSYEIQQTKNLKLAIDEKKIDECIELLQNADPTGEIVPDTQELLEMEDQCYMMGPLIDNKLQKIDQKHAVLEDLNLKILDAFQVYNNLMKESISKSTNFMYSSSTINQLNSISVNGNQPQQAVTPLLSGNPAAQISFAGAPPSLDSSSMLLANQLNSLVNNSSPMNGSNILPPQTYGIPPKTMPNSAYQLDPSQQMLQMNQQIMYQQQSQNQMYSNNMVPKLDPTLNKSSSQLNQTTSLPQMTGGQLFNYAPTTTSYQNM